MTDGRVSGPVLFARFAYPPNQYGYCGPDDAAGFFQHGAAGDEAGVRDAAAAFDGALPFLRLITDALGVDDTLHPRVVEAYWVGGADVGRVTPDDLRPELAAAMQGRCGPLFGGLAEALAAGALPHHSFVVLCVYPWVGMLGDPRRTPPAMRVLDRCRIRPGIVRAVDGDRASVESAPLEWSEGRLRLGDPVVETVRTGIAGVGPAPRVTVGDRVALHWDWVCDVLDRDRQAAIEDGNRRHLDLANRVLAGGIRV